MSPSRKSDPPRRARGAHAHRRHRVTTPPGAAPAPPRSRRPRYATREEQLRELLGQLRERDRRVREALIAVLTGAPPRVLAAVGTLLGFVDAQGHGRR